MDNKISRKEVGRDSYFSSLSSTKAIHSPYESQYLVMVDDNSHNRYHIEHPLMGPVFTYHHRQVLMPHTGKLDVHNKHCST